VIPKNLLNKYGGEGGIRTPGTLASTSDFESGAFNRALPPLRGWNLYRLGLPARAAHLSATRWNGGSRNNPASTSIPAARESAGSRRKTSLTPVYRERWAGGNSQCNSTSRRAPGLSGNSILTGFPRGQTGIRREQNASRRRQPGRCATNRPPLQSFPFVVAAGKLPLTARAGLVHWGAGSPGPGSG
jgi:hypothetical protein